MSVVAELGDRIAALTPADAKSLRLWFKDTYDIEPAGGGIVAPPPPKEEKPPEPTEFNVIYEGFAADKKMNVIKTVREVMGLGLAEAKLFSESTGKPVKENLDAKTADELRKKLVDAGCNISVKPA